MKTNFVFPAIATLGLVPMLLVGGPADADGRVGNPSDKVTSEVHGYSSVTDVTESVLKEHPGLGERTRSVPQIQLIRGGPAITTDGEGSPVADK
jgi:hypothetical protein